MPRPAAKLHSQITVFNKTCISLKTLPLYACAQTKYMYMYKRIYSFNECIYIYTSYIYTHVNPYTHTCAHVYMYMCYEFYEHSPPVLKCYINTYQQPCVSNIFVYIYICICRYIDTYVYSKPESCDMIFMHRCMYIYIYMDT